MSLVTFRIEICYNNTSDSKAIIFVTHAGLYDSQNNLCVCLTHTIVIDTSMKPQGIKSFKLLTHSCFVSPLY